MIVSGKDRSRFSRYVGNSASIGMLVWTTHGMHGPRLEDKPVQCSPPGHVG